MIVGPTSSGKTVLVQKFLESRASMCSHPKPHTILFYSHMQDAYIEMKNRSLVDEFVQGYPGLESIQQMIEPYRTNKQTLLIFDDGLSMIANDISRLFTEISHHYKSSIFFIGQNLFYDNKDFRNLALNTHYLFLMKNPSNIQQIQTLSSRLAGYRKSWIVEAYQSATRLPYTYLLIDNTQTCPDHLRVRANIFPSETSLKKPQICFVEKSSKNLTLF